MELMLVVDASSHKVWRFFHESKGCSLVQFAKVRKRKTKKSTAMDVGDDEEEGSLTTSEESEFESARACNICPEDHEA
jgi:hypothetical protein